MKKIIGVIIVAIALVIGVYFMIDFYNTDESLYVDANSIGINNYSREDFYTEYKELVIANENKDADEGTGANGDSQAILGNSVLNSNNSGSLSEGMAQSALGFYKQNLSVTKKGNPISVKIAGVPLYDGLPWSSSGAYELDTAVCNAYLSRYLNSNFTSTVAIDNNCKIKDIVVEGVKCLSFAGYPILGFCDIDQYGNSIGWSSGARPKKVCAILQDAAGTTYYLPVSCVDDAKGHIWPGGLAQTFLSNNSGSSSGWNFNSDNGTITGSIIGKTVTSIDQIRAGYSDVKYKGTNVVTTAPQFNLEVNSQAANALKAYKLIGFISWK